MSIVSAPVCSCSSDFLNPIDSDIPIPISGRTSLATLIELLPSEKKIEVLKTLELIQDKDQILPQVCELAATRDYTKFYDLFMNDNFEFYALACVQEGLLTPIQFGTLMFVRAALEEPDLGELLTIVPLYVGESVSKQAWDAIRETLTVKDQNNTVATPEQLARFFEFARALPESEKYFVYYPYEFDIHKKTNGKRDVFIRIVYAAQFNLFGATHMEGQHVRMIPSLGMIQAFLDATVGGGITLKPRIGESTAESIHKSMKEENAREFLIHCPLIAPAPKMADRYTATPLSFMYHDLYHVWLCGNIPPSDRRFYTDLADLMKKWPLTLSKELCEEVEKPQELTEHPFVDTAQKMYHYIVDMEFSRYRRLDFTVGWNLDDRRERTMYRISDHLTHLLLIMPGFVCINEYAKSAFKDMKENLLGHYGVWMLYKQDYADFSEVTAKLNTFTPNERAEFVSNVKEIMMYNSTTTISLIPIKHLREMEPKELSEVIALRNINYWGIETLKDQGFSFKHLWALPAAERIKAVKEPDSLITLTVFNMSS